MLILKSMHDSVKKVFYSFTSRFEGAVPWMYLDVKGLVTTAVGNLIDPVSQALSLPFVRADGSKASGGEIAADWNNVKTRPELAKKGHNEARRFTKLRLTPEGMNELVLRQVERNEVILRKRFPQYDEWPADAQLAMNSMAWALGAGFDSPATEKVDGIFPKFSACMYVGDFLSASQNCWIGPRYRSVSENGKKKLIQDPYAPAEECVPDPMNPGVHPRNLANVLLLRNASMVKFEGSDRTVLHYPNVLTESEPIIEEIPPVIDNWDAPVDKEPLSEDDEVTNPRQIVPVPPPSPPANIDSKYGFIMSLLMKLFAFFTRKNP